MIKWTEKEKKKNQNSQKPLWCPATVTAEP